MIQLGKFRRFYARARAQHYILGPWHVPEIWGYVRELDSDTVERMTTFGLVKPYFTSGYIYV